MIILGENYNADLNEILAELQREITERNLPYLQGRQINTDTSIQVCCPYHANGREKKPSAGIRKSDGKFHCFACNTVHELPEVISYCLGYYTDYLGKYGLNWLNRRFHAMPKDNSFLKNFNPKQKEQTEKITYVTEEELDSYRYTHPYMYKRGLTDDLIELFDIGFDAKSSCITFPVRDINGNCLFVARRSVNSKYFNYPSGALKPLYGLYEMYKTYTDIKELQRKELIVVESMLDALAFWRVGKIAVALNGLGTPYQCRQIEQVPCRKIILATDNDTKGLEARERLKTNIRYKLILQYRYPEGRKDANECTDDELVNICEFFA